MNWVRIGAVRDGITLHEALNPLSNVTHPIDLAFALAFAIACAWEIGGEIASVSTLTKVVRIAFPSFDNDDLAYRSMCVSRSLQSGIG